MVCGLGAGAIHTMLNWGSNIPTVGASGAISGVMGAYVVMYPRSKIVTLVPLIIFWFTVQIPAWFFVGFWIVLQFLGGLGSLGGRTQGGTAFWAHVGGFVVGLVLAKAFQSSRRTVY
jgi:hypothetical protein